MESDYQLVLFLLILVYFTEATRCDLSGMFAFLTSELITLGYFGYLYMTS